MVYYEDAPLMAAALSLRPVSNSAARLALKDSSAARMRAVEAAACHLLFALSSADTAGTFRILTC